MSELQGLLLLSLTFIIVLLGVEIIYHKAHVLSEVSRKIAHMAVGLLCIFAPIELRNQWFILIITSLFIFFLYFSKKNNWLNSVHNIKRKSYGAYLLPVSIYLSFMIYKFYDYNEIFFLPLLIVTISDPLASFAGLIWKTHLEKNNRQRTRKYSKTTIGTITFFVSAFICSFFFLQQDQNISLLNIVFLSLVISLLSTLVEAISYKGWDNLNIPVTVAVILVIYIEFIV